MKLRLYTDKSGRRSSYTMYKTLRRGLGGAAAAATNCNERAQLQEYCTVVARRRIMTPDSMTDSLLAPVAE